MPLQKVGYEKKPATVLIAVSLALFLSFSLPLPTAVMCVIQFKLFPKRWHLERDRNRESQRERECA